MDEMEGPPCALHHSATKKYLWISCLSAATRNPLIRANLHNLEIIILDRHFPSACACVWVMDRWITLHLPRFSTDPIGKNFNKSVCRLLNKTYATRVIHKAYWMDSLAVEELQWFTDMFGNQLHGISISTKVPQILIDSQTLLIATHYEYYISTWYRDCLITHININ